MDQPVENTSEKPKTSIIKKLFRGLFIFGRWVFVFLLAVILIGGLYFKAPWKIMVLDAFILSLLTVVPKTVRKYGWGALGVAVLGVTIWIFLPESDAGNWQPYTFDEEFAILEAKRIVPSEANAAPLYEELIEKWKEIEKTDPFPEQEDDGCQTLERVWTADEFPQISEWFKRHDSFFQDLIAATQKPACVFPAAATTEQLSIALENLRPIRHFAQQLIRASYLDIGEGKGNYLSKQMAALNLGQHINQQPLMINRLVGVAIESMTYKALTYSIITQPLPNDIAIGDFLSTTTSIRTGELNSAGQWRQTIEYEKLFAKNLFGLSYETNSEGTVRFSHFKTTVNAISIISPELDSFNLSNSFWRRIRWRFSRLMLWFSGLPKDPAFISKLVDDIYSDLDTLDTKPFELNYNYVIKQMINLSAPSFKMMSEEILPKIETQKRGTEIACDLILHKKQHGQYPDRLDDLLTSSKKHVKQELYAGFVYKKIGNSFKLYHIGQNQVDESGVYQKPPIDPNCATLESLMSSRPEPDDILIWPTED